MRAAWLLALVLAAGCASQPELKGPVGKTGTVTGEPTAPRNRARVHTDLGMAYYARGNMSKEDETAVDVIAYSAHIACQLGAHVVKVKPPTSRVARDDGRKYYEKIPIETLADRIRHVKQAAFAGKRIVIFSGGEAKGTQDVLEEIKQIHAGGGDGSIMGRNAFQRPFDEAVKLLRDTMAIYAS